MAEINIYIDKHSFANRDDELLSSSEIGKDKVKTSDLINSSLKHFFKNEKQKDLDNNISRLNELLLKVEKRIQFVYLDKFSLIFNDNFFNSNKKIKNLCIVISLKESINGYNSISLYVDAIHKKDVNQEIFFTLNRIEFLNENKPYETNKSNSPTTINFSFEEKSTIFYDIQEYAKKAKKYFNNDDYDAESDKLLLNKWYDFLDLLFDFYKKRKITDELTNKIFIYDGEVYLASKQEFLTDKRTLLISDQHQDYENYKITRMDKKEIEYSELELKFKKIENEIKELEKLEIDFLQKVKELNNDIKKLDEKLENENLKYEENNKLLMDFKKRIDDLKILNQDIKDEINNFESQNLKLSKENKTLEQQLDIKNEKIKSNNGDDLKSLYSQIDLIKNQIKENEKNKIEFLKEIEKYKKIINENNKKLETKNKEYSKQKSIVENIETTINGIKEEKMPLENKKASYNKDISSIKKNIEDKENRINSIKDKISKISNDYPILYKVQHFSFEDEEYIFKDKISDIFLDQDNKQTIGLKTQSSGDFAKIKRYYYGLRQLNKGYVKNYKLFCAIKNPSSIKKYVNQIPSNILKKYKLNPKQKSAVEKAINNDDIFYLQGPPGTGKTQTLCAISECVVKENQNLVMCSSTHEAIDNFLERLFNLNKNDPNIVILKYKFSNEKDKKRDSLFSEEKIYRNFKDCIYNFILPDKSGALSEYQKKYGTSLPETIFKKGLPMSFLELILNNIDLFNEKIEILKNDKNDDEIIWPLDEIYTKLDKESILLAKRKLINFYDNKLKKDEQEYNKTILFDDVIREKNIKDHSLIIDLILKKGLDGIFKNERKVDNNYLNTIDSIKQKYKAIDDSYETMFLEYIIKRDLINVIGITTSSRLSIELAQIKRNLFNDYRVDVVLIDEVSKSSTPEIISKSILAKKIVLSGDYLQLPPSVEFTNDQEILELLEFIQENEKNNNHYFSEWDGLYENIRKNDKFNQKIIDDVKDEIEELFKTSFFVIQINKLKNSDISDENKSYEFLQESRRFSGKIIDLVNIIYNHKNEKLIPVIDSIPKYNLSLLDKNLDSELVMVDTSEVDFNFFNKYHLDGKISSSESFDQEGTPFNYNNKKINLSGGSLYNQYNALIDIDLVKKIYEQNKDKINSNNRIGVITLTKTQKQLVNRYVDISAKDIKHFLKIDTIDNFQGREEEIIIVDFIRGQNKIKNKVMEKNIKRNLSFLEEVERINVAISRAKSKLILVGPFKDYYSNLTIKEYGKLFKQYYDCCKDSDDSYIMYKEGGN